MSFDALNRLICRITSGVRVRTVGALLVVAVLLPHLAVGDPPRPRSYAPMLDDPVPQVWDDDCKDGVARTTATIRVRAVPASIRVRPVRRELRLADGPELRGALAVATDLTGSGTDRLYVRDVNGAVFAGEPLPGGTISFRSLPLRAAPDGFELQLLTTGSTGYCARLFLPGEPVGSPIQVLSWKTLKGEVDELAHPLKRQAAGSLFLLMHEGQNPFPTFFEVDATANQSHRAVYDGTQWHRDLIPQPILASVGIGYVPSVPTRTGIGVTIHAGTLVATLTAAPVQLLSVPLREPFEIRSGDFNGDGFVDLVLLQPGEVLRQSLLTLTFPQSPLTFPVAGLAEALHGLRVLTTGDIDGDGADEIIATDESRIFSVSFEPQEGCGPFDMMVDGVKQQPRPDGSYSITAPLNAKLNMEFSSNTALLETESRTVTASRPIVQTMGLFCDPLPAARNSRAPMSIVRTPVDPVPCIGFMPRYQDENPERWGRVAQNCVSDYAVVEVDDGRSSFATCCPLPAGVLRNSESIVVTNKSCPPNSVVTGIEGGFEPMTRACAACNHRLRCTMLDTKRYALDPARQGVYWGAGTEIFRDRASRSRLDAPLGMREAIGRNAMNNWDTDGCVGLPWGSVLVGGGGKHCSDYRFAKIRPLSPKAQVDPAFPFKSCRTPVDAFDPLSGCD